MDSLTNEEVDRQFNEAVYHRSWFEPVPAGDGGSSSMLASPLVLLGMVAGAAFWAGVGWLAFR